MDLCDACGTVKAKAKLISKKYDPSKKITIVVELMLVDVTRIFPLKTTK